MEAKSSCDELIVVVVVETVGNRTLSSTRSGGGDRLVGSLHLLDHNMPRSRSPPSRPHNRDRSRSPLASSSSRPAERRDDYGRSAYAPRSRDDDRARRSPPSAPARRGASPNFARDRERERAAYDARAGIADAAAPPPEAEAPNFERSGLLAAASNTVNGVALKYHEPPEARKPKKKWRLYVYKDGKEVGECL